MEIDTEISIENDKNMENNSKNELDTNVSYRYILYERETFYQTDKIIQRGPWCPSISMIRQSGEVLFFLKKYRLIFLKK